MAKLVAIYCGHGISSSGSWDSGCVYKGYQEAKLVMPIVKSAAYYLKKAGVNVITDYKSNNINMNAQVAKANAKGADVFVSVHLDYDKAPKGTMPLYYSEKGKKLAQYMNKSVQYYSSLGTRGVTRRTDLYELKGTDMPACIFEAGSIKADLHTIIYEYDFIGFGIAKGICRFLGVTFKGPQYSILRGARVMEPLVKKNLTYSGKATNVTYQAAVKGNKKVNCALYVSWILQRAKILSKKQRIWLGNAVHGSGTATMKKKFKISHPNKLPKNIKFHVADVIGYQWGSSKKNLVHTMIVLRMDGGRPIFATCGGSDLKAKDLSRKRTYYEKKAVKTLCRYK